MASTGSPLNIEKAEAGSNLPLRDYVSNVAQSVNDYLQENPPGAGGAADFDRIVCAEGAVVVSGGNVVITSA